MGRIRIRTKVQKVQNKNKNKNRYKETYTNEKSKAIINLRKKASKKIKGKKENVIMTFNRAQFRHSSVKH